MKLTDITDDPLFERGKAPRSLCISRIPDDKLGASQLASCKSQGLRARDGDKSHLIGHISDFENIKLNTSTHWSHRKDCPNCPVLQICQGSCMFLEGDMWDLACNNAYSDNIPFFMAGWELLTGTIPYFIDGPQADDRKDIIGAVHGIPKKKTFTIHAI